MTELTTVQFHGADLIAIRGETPETTLVAMKSVVEGMGLTWQAQHRKITEHPILKTCITNTTIQIPGDDQRREQVFMPLNRLNFWLATVQPNKVSPDLRGKIIEYQIECADVLFAHFFGRPMPAQDMANLRREIADIRSTLQKVIDGFDPAQSAVVGYIPMLDVVSDQGAVAKGRRGLVQKCSTRMRRWCVATSRSDAVRISRESKRYLFGVDAVKAWLAAEGLSMIGAHKARVAGQGVLLFRVVNPVPEPPPQAEAL